MNKIKNKEVNTNKKLNKGEHFPKEAKIIKIGEKKS